jgi:DNA repair protein RecO (recombination protein O)
MQYHKLTGVIINRRSLKDSDRFLTIYTAEAGKLSVYARGIRSMKSKRGSQLDLFSHIKFEIYEKGDRRTLTSVELLNGHQDSKESLSNISRLFQIGELVDVLTPENDPHAEVYELLLTALANLARFETPEYLRRFKKKLLEHLGYGTEELVGADLDNYIESLLDRPLRTRLSLD